MAVMTSNITHHNRRGPAIAACAVIIGGIFAVTYVILRRSRHETPTATSVAVQESPVPRVHDSPPSMVNAAQEEKRTAAVPPARKIPLLDDNQYISPEVQTMLRAFMKNTTILSLKGGEQVYLSDYLKDILFDNPVHPRVLLSDGTQELWGARWKAGTARGYAYLSADGATVEAVAATNTECTAAAAGPLDDCLPVMNVYLQPDQQLSPTLEASLKTNAADAFGALGETLPQYRNVPLHIYFVH